jgi:AcrR family transcriptional regulator
MKQRQHQRREQTRERLRAAAHRLFLQHGYLATSVDAILAESGISSKETLYRYYANKEALFVDVLRQLTHAQPGFAEAVAALPKPRDLASLSLALTFLAREILAKMSQPSYLPLLRIIFAESSRFPDLGSMFLSTVTQPGFTMLTSLLQEAREEQIIADVDFDAVTHALLGGLLSYVLVNMVLAQDAPAVSLDRADAVVAVIMRALTPD